MLDKAKHKSGRKLSYLRNVNVRWGSVNTDDIFEMYFEDDQVERFSLRAGDVLVCEGGEPGRAAVWHGQVPEMKFQKALHRVRFNVPFDARLLVYLLESLAKSGGIERRFTGSTIKHFTREAFVQLPVPVPPVKQQQEIVAEIEKQFTRLEAGVAALRRVQANLKRYRAAVLKAACEGKLVPTEAELQKSAGKRQKGFESGEQLLERIRAERRQIHERIQVCAARKKKYKEPTPPNDPIDQKLPAGWTWATWDQIGSSQNGRPFHSAEYQPTGFKLLRPGNLHMSGKVVWDDGNTRCMPLHRADQNSDLIVRGGELVMNLTAQSLKDEFLGRACLTAEGEQCLLNQRLARLTPIIISPQFVLYLLKAWHFRRFVDGLNSGSLIQHMFTSQLAEFTFPLPPRAEQTRMVAEVERRLSVVEELEAVVSANLQRATRLQQSVLQQAFSGGLLAIESSEKGVTKWGKVGKGGKKS